MFWLTLVALGADAIDDGLSERTRAAVEKLEVRVDGAWADGHVVFVDFRVRRFDRMLELDGLSLDGPNDGRYFGGECMGPGDAYAYCWIDEGKRRVRARFGSVSALGKHTLRWYGKPVAEFVVKPGGGAPQLPKFDGEAAEGFDLRPPSSFEITEVSIFADPGYSPAPGRRFVVLDAAFSGAPPSMLGEGMQLRFGDLSEPVFALECSVDGVPLRSCSPMPAKGTVRIVAPLPFRAVAVSIGYGEAELAGVDDLEELDQTALSEALLDQLPLSVPAAPLEPIRAWTTESLPGDVWADLAVGGALDLDRLEEALSLHDLQTGQRIGRLEMAECYPSDPGEDPGTEPVPCESGSVIRVYWRTDRTPEEIQLGSFGGALGEPLQVAASGPAFSTLSMARAAQGGGDPRGAMRLYQQVLEADPGQREAIYALAALAEELDDPSAGSWARRLLESSPEHRVDAYQMLASAQLRAERYEAAVGVLQRGLEELPGNARIQFDLGRAYLELGDSDAAERWMVRSLEQEPWGVVGPELSEAMKLRGEHGLALLALTRSLLLYPQSPTASGSRSRLSSWLTQPTVWPGGSADRGPLGAVVPRRVSERSDRVAVEQLEALILAWDAASRAGAKTPHFAPDPWYGLISAPFRDLVEADLVEAAAYLALYEPQTWPPTMNVKVDRAYRLLQR